MRGPFTGRHMAVILVVGFGIVIAVNFLMAYLAARDFGGVVVENSYVASQNYNSWLKEADAQRQLGWEATPRRHASGALEVATAGVPAGADVVAEIRRPVGPPDARRLTLAEHAAGQFLAPGALPAGRWIVRVIIDSDGKHWRTEREIG
ncbi:FixH family protein [Qipengyuania sp. YIM B01966]|uniref:FixH family protein n=1 Tax=Qipengyuania sp. YIM B01966 TaxID=2778646 RepID=UPI0018F6FC74|nr:FixH family protein [Qipengyuania sp. YIM B01966]